MGISLGRVNTGATYSTTASDGSFTFPGLADGTYNLAASRYMVNGNNPLYAYSTQMGVVVNGTV